MENLKSSHTPAIFLLSNNIGLLVMLLWFCSVTQARAVWGLAVRFHKASQPTFFLKSQVSSPVMNVPNVGCCTLFFHLKKAWLPFCKYCKLVVLWRLTTHGSEQCLTSEYGRFLHFYTGFCELSFVCTRPLELCLVLLLNILKPGMFSF